MTLYTTDYLEYYLPLVGWAGNNGIWSILVASGVFALPFVVIVVQEWLRAYLPANMRRTAKCLWPGHPGRPWASKGGDDRATQ